MTLHKRFTIVALTISAAWSANSFAQDSPAAAQCVALVEQLKIDEAEPFCAQAAEEPGKDGKLLYADFLARTGNLDGAIERYDGILKGVDLGKPTQTEYTALRNRALVGFNAKYMLADDDASAALKLAPNDAELLQAGAQMSPSEVRRLDYADRLVALDPKSVEAHVTRSFVLAAARKPEEALAAADTASKLDPKSALPQFARGFIYRSTGEFARAEREFAAAARKAPQEAAIKVSQAEMLAELKRFDAAIEVTTDALNQSPNFPNALRMRAAARLQMGDAAGALADLEIADKVEPHFEGPDMSGRAQNILEAQEAMRPESIASLEQDRQILLAAIRAHLYRQCGQYSVSDDATNEALNAYRDCIQEWYKVEDEAVANSLGPEIRAAAERFNATAQWVDEAQELQCSKMPKKSRCIPDSLVARAQAATEIADPRAMVGEGEFARLNQEVDAYNSHVKVNNALIHTSNFLNALAEALSQQ